MGVTDARNIEKEAERPIMGAQADAFVTIAKEGDIPGQSISSLCRMYGKENDAVDHIVSSCEKLTH